MITYTKAYAEEMVAAGGKWADAHWDADWPWRINTDRLNIADGNDCMFGQMYAEPAAEDGYSDGWRYATERGVIFWERTYELGFAVRYDHNAPDDFETNVLMINRAWRELIIKRRDTTPKPIPA